MTGLATPEAYIQAMTTTMVTPTAVRVTRTATKAVTSRAFISACRSTFSRLIRHAYISPTNRNDSKSVVFLKSSHVDTPSEASIPRASFNSAR